MLLSASLIAKQQVIARTTSEIAIYLPLPNPVQPPGCIRQPKVLWPTQACPWCRRRAVCCAAGWGPCRSEMGDPEWDLSTRSMT